MPKTLKLWLLALSLLLGSGCSRVEVAWDRELGSEVAGEMVIQEGRIFLGTARQHLLCLELATGQTMWDTPLPLPLRGRPVVQGGKVFVSTTSPEASALLSLSLESGQIEWRQELPSGLSAPAARAGAVVVTGPGLYGFSEDGRRLWTTELGLGKKPGPPAVGGDRVVVGTDQGSLLALDVFKGEPAWQRGLEGAVVGTPCIRENTVIVALTGGLAAFRLSDGAPVWESKPEGTLVCGRDLILVRSRELSAVARDSGVVRWRQDIAEGAAVAAGSHVVLGTGATLTGLDPADGRVLWEYRAGAPLAAPPAVGEGWVVGATEDGILFGLDEE